MTQTKTVIPSEARNLQVTNCRPFASLKVTAVSLGVTLLLASSLQGQLGSHNPMPGPSGTYAITSAKIVTVAGADIERGTVVVADGKVAAVGANVPVPAGATTIDARGAHVYPGMMDAGTSMGLSEIPQGAASTV